jgi:hypothetical protein
MIDGLKLYAVLHCAELDSRVYAIQRHPISLVLFTVQNIEDPKVEPIGSFFQSGIRYYIFRGRYWSEVALPYYIVAGRIEALGIRSSNVDLYWLLQRYFNSTVPSDYGVNENIEFCRAIYQVNDPPRLRPPS